MDIEEAGVSGLSVHKSHRQTLNKTNRVKCQDEAESAKSGNTRQPFLIGIAGGWGCADLSLPDPVESETRHFEVAGIVP